MKKTDWLNDKQYKKFLKDNAFIKVHGMEWEYKKYDRATGKKVKRDGRTNRMKFKEFIKITYSEFKLRDIKQ